MAIAFFLIPLQWMAAWLFAVLIHELCHYLVIYLCRGNVYSIELGMGGAKMHAFIPSARREFLCAIAGPAGSLLLLVFARWIPKVAICGFLHAGFNLLPIMPLDGGRAVKSLLYSYLPQCYWLADFLEICTFAILLGAGTYISSKTSVGLLLLLIPAALFFKREKIKNLAKR